MPCQMTVCMPQLYTVFGLYRIIFKSKISGCPFITQSFANSLSRSDIFCFPSLPSRSIWKWFCNEETNKEHSCVFGVGCCTISRAIVLQLMRFIANNKQEKRSTHCPLPLAYFVRRNFYSRHLEFPVLLCGIIFYSHFDSGACLEECNKVHVSEVHSMWHSSAP